MFQRQVEIFHQSCCLTGKHLKDWSQSNQENSFSNKKFRMPIWIVICLFFWLWNYLKLSNISSRNSRVNSVEFPPILVPLYAVNLVKVFCLERFLLDLLQNSFKYLLICLLCITTFHCNTLTQHHMGGKLYT